MFRSVTVLILASTSLIVLHRSSIADEPKVDAPQHLDKNGPLYKALLELKRDIGQLRIEIRGVPSEPRGLQAKKPAVPTVVQAGQTRTPAVKPAIKTTKRSILQPVAISPSKSDHWSFQPIRRPSPPTVRDQTWTRDDLDRFILARLERAKLTPNRDADRYTLIRRVAFDLTGLPPTEAEIRDFVNDTASLDKALPRVVDRYLNSPRFGERWGRHWLDVVRYADSVGRNWNAPFIGARNS